VSKVTCKIIKLDETFNSHVTELFYIKFHVREGNEYSLTI
jgi:hypothetical protein